MSHAVKPGIVLALWRAARPQTLWCALAPVLLAAALAIERQQASWWALFCTIAVSLLIQIGTNFFNDYADGVRGTDNHHRLGPARATASGWLSPQTVLIASLISFAFAALSGLWAVVELGWPLLLIGSLAIASGFLYTGGPYPLAYHGWGDVFAFVFFGWVAVLGSYFVHTRTLSWSAFVAGTCMGCFATAILSVNNLRDRIDDAANNKRTLAVQFGAKFTCWQYTILVGLAYCIMAIFAILTKHWPLLLVALPIVQSPTALIRSVWHSEGKALNQLLAATAQLQAQFALLSGILVLW